MSNYLYVKCPLVILTHLGQSASPWMETHSLCLAITLTTGICDFSCLARTLPEVKLNLENFLLCYFIIIVITFTTANNYCIIMKYNTVFHISLMSLNQISVKNKIIYKWHQAAPKHFSIRRQKSWCSALKLSHFFQFSALSAFCWAFLMYMGLLQISIHIGERFFAQTDKWP